MRRSRRGIPALALVLLGLALLAGPAGAAEFDKYELESASASLSSLQAGAHADFTTSFQLTQKEGSPYGQSWDILISLPPGMIGNPQRFPRCSIAQFGERPAESECPQDAQVGVSEILLGPRRAAR